jgi:hypothetical protein
MSQYSTNGNSNYSNNNNKLDFGKPKIINPKGHTIDESVIRVLDDFVREHMLHAKDGNPTFVSRRDIENLKGRTGSVELLLNYMNQAFGSLFYGTTKNISKSIIPETQEKKLYLNPDGCRIIYASSLGAPAIIKGLTIKEKLDERGMNIPAVITHEKPFNVEIYGLNDKSLRNEGFVYIINNTQGFKKHPTSTWQYMSITNNPIELQAKIEINHYDFKHPINDVTNRIPQRRLDVETRRRYTSR